MSDEDWELGLAFDTDGREFVRGFQMGLVYGRFWQRDEMLAAIVYAENAEMLVRMQERGAPIEVLDNGADWLVVRSTLPKMEDSP